MRAQPGGAGPRRGPLRSPGPPPVDPPPWHFRTNSDASSPQRSGLVVSISDASSMFARGGGCSNWEVFRWRSPVLPQSSQRSQEDPACRPPPRSARHRRPPQRAARHASSPIPTPGGPTSATTWPASPTPSCPSQSLSPWPSQSSLPWWCVVRVLARHRSTSTRPARRGRVPPAVDPKGAASFWRNLHPVLAARHHLLAAPHSVAFEVTSSANGIGLRIWVPPGVSTHAVARAVSSAWPGSRCRIGPIARRSFVAEPSPVASCVSRRRRGCHSGPTTMPTRCAPCWVPSSPGSESDEGAVQVVVAPAGARATRSGRERRPIPSRPAARWLLCPGCSPRGGRRRRSHRVPTPCVRQMFATSCRRRATSLPSRSLSVTGSRPLRTDRHTRRRLRSRAHELTATFGVYAGRNHLVARHRVGAGAASNTGQSRMAKFWASPRLPRWRICRGTRRSPGSSTPARRWSAPPSGVLAERAGSQDFEEDDDALF